jgi:predicted dehydrogenase
MHSANLSIWKEEVYSEMPDKINVAVVGYGGMGAHHVRELLKMPNYNVKGIYDIKEERCELARQNGIHAYNSLDELLADDVELITIATYNEFHKPIAIRAMEAGVNVISEKPVTISLSDLEEMIEASERTGKLFTVHQNRRWDDDFLTAKEIIESDTLGRIFRIESRVQGSRGIPGDWRAEKAHGGGMVLDWGVHLFDQILMLNLDNPVVSVHANLSNVTNEEVDDGCYVTFTFENGLVCYVEVATSNFISLPRWYILGENGTAVIEDWDLNGKIVKIKDWEKIDAVPIKAGAGITKTMAPRTSETIKEFPLPKVTADWSEYYINIYDVLRNGAQQIVTHDQLRRSMKAIEAVFESAEKNTVVKCRI